MSENKNTSNLSDLKDNFQNIKTAFRPAVLLKMGDKCADTSSLAAVCKELNFGTVAPLWTEKSASAYGSDEYYACYSSLLDSLKKEGMSAVFCDDCDFPSGRAGGELCERYPEYTAKHLKKYECTCTEGNLTKYRLKTAGKTMSIVAFEEDTNEVLDLRSFVNGEYLEWDTPEGNWTVQQYCCESDDGEKYVNYLSYDASMAFVSLTYARFAEQFKAHVGDTVKMTFYNDIQFRAQNRRMWDESFNDHFIKKYGYDPAPYYPVLYGDIAENTAHYRAAFFNCRTDMLLGGFFKAVSDYTKSVGLTPMGDVAEAKTTSAPFIFGDGMKFQSLNGAVGIDLMHRYMYGFNGLKIASSASYNYDIRDVVCEIFGDYNKFDESVIYRETMNAYARGVNSLIAHLPHEMLTDGRAADFIKKWNGYASRCQSLLQGGRHVCDVAMLYPIHSLEAQSALFESPTSGFEYPYTPTDADYMNLINSVMNYCGHDVTVLHPDVFMEKCRIDDSILHLENAYNKEEYKVLIVPGTMLIDIGSLRKIREFFLSGGKIIATSKLPTLSLEFNPEQCQKGVSPLDDEVKQIVCEIFGVTGGEGSDIEPYYVNKNDKGGEAYFIPTSLTAADGTYVTDDKLLRYILGDCLNVGYDVEISSMPRVSGSGILSLPRPMYIDIDTSKFAGGVFNHIHKKADGYDIYFFANSTNADYNGKISLRGKFGSCEIFDPHTGAITPAEITSECKCGYDYTSICVDIPSSSSLFIVAKDEE